MNEVPGGMGEEGGIPGGSGGPPGGGCITVCSLSFGQVFCYNRRRTGVEKHPDPIHRRTELRMQDHTTPSVPPCLPVILCECGCGNPAPLASHTRKERGQVKGQPVRFISGHNSRLNLSDSGYVPIALALRNQLILKIAFNPTLRRIPFKNAHYGLVNVTATDMG